MKDKEAQYQDFFARLPKQPKTPRQSQYFPEPKLNIMILICLFFDNIDIYIIKK